MFLPLKGKIYSFLNVQLKKNQTKRINKYILVTKEKPDCVLRIWCGLLSFFPYKNVVLTEIDFSVASFV